MDLNIAFVLILLGGYGARKLAHKLKLPSVLGMTLWGVALSYFAKESIPDALWELAPFLKSLALIIILLRAGLGIRRDTLNKVGRTAGIMSFLPASFEAFAVILSCRFLLGWSWAVSGVTGFVLAAVSPAVVVPSMLGLIEKGLGKKKEIPTLVLASASLDDVFAITMFTLFLRMATQVSVAYGQILLALPVSLIVGILPGLLLGFGLSWFFRRFHSRIRATEKALLLLGLAVILLKVGDLTGTAALLGIMTAGFVLLEREPKVAHELAAKLNKAWVFAEIILFVLIGLSVDVEVALSAGLMGLGILGIGLAARSAGVLLSTHKSGLNWRERFFCVLAYLPKATVQAAIGSVPLAAGVAQGETILAFAVLAIIVSAPLGLIGIRLGGERLLSP